MATCCRSLRAWLQSSAFHWIVVRCASSFRELPSNRLSYWLNLKKIIYQNENAFKHEAVLVQHSFLTGIILLLLKKKICVKKIFKIQIWNCSRYIAENKPPQTSHNSMAGIVSSFRGLKKVKDLVLLQGTVWCVNRRVRGDPFERN